MNTNTKLFFFSPNKVIFFAVIILIGIVINLGEWKSNNKVIESDVISYYAYLPAVFIYQDLSLRFLDKANADIKDKVWYERAEEGSGRVIKTTMGVSYFYFPFFIVANQIANGFGYYATGYNTPYRLAIIFSSIFYFIVGLLFIKKLLVKYYSPSVVSWVLLVIGVGTNIVNYATREPGMSHVYSFSAIAALLYFIDKWYNDKKVKHLYLIALISGIIVLVRPTNIMVFIIFLLYGVNSVAQLKDRLKDYLSEWKHLLLSLMLFFLPILPQLIYWKYTSGSWLFFSYTDNEHFFFNDPKIIEGLFSYRKGWLLYTPLMALTFIGLFLPMKKNRNRWSVAIFIAVLLYVTFSWWSWWYGGSFGSRVMVDHYAIFSMPIAAFFYWLSKRKIIIRLVSTVLVLFLIWVNQYQAYQYRDGSLHHSGMNKKTYWMNFLSNNITQEYYDSLTEIDHEAAKKGER